MVLAFRLGETTISLPAYGLAVSVAIALVVLLVARQAPRVGLARDAVLDLSFLLLLSGLAGSRLLYVLLNAGDYARLCAGSGQSRGASAALRDCLAPFRIWDGGLVFYGGALGAAAVAAVFARKQGWRFAVLGDLFAPALALGHALGRLGCFFAGCCFGQVCAASGVPCVAFPPESVAHSQLVAVGALASAAAATPPVHPTQLYESLALLALYFALLWRAPRKHFHGEILCLYVLGYAGLRMLLELYRGDLTRQFLLELRWPALAGLLGLPPGDPLGLSTSQAVSLALLAAGGWFLRTRLARAHPDVAVR